MAREATIQRWRAAGVREGAASIGLRAMDGAWTSTGPSVIGLPQTVDRHRQGEERPGRGKTPRLTSYLRMILVSEMPKDFEGNGPDDFGHAPDAGGRLLRASPPDQC